MKSSSVASLIGCSFSFVIMRSCVVMGVIGAGVGVGVVGCGDSDEDPATAFSRGEYTVPVDPALAHVATNDVEKVSLRAKEDGKYRLVYKLPRVLAGEGKLVDLEGDKNERSEIVLTGPAGSATCTKAPDGSITLVTCHEHLTGITVDLDQVGQALDERGITGQDRADYLEVARQFSIDPLGVLRFEER